MVQLRVQRLLGISLSRKLHESFSQDDESSIASEPSHPLDSIPSNLVLNYTLNPFVQACKFLGIFPLKLDNEEGTASFKFRQLTTIFYIAFFVAFVATSVLYSPLYLEVMKSDVDESIFQVAKYLFVCGQYLAAAVTMIGIPRLCRRTASLWNKLEQTVALLCEERVDCRRAFRPSYTKARLAIFFWILIVLTSWYLWWKSFRVFFRNYFLQQTELVYYFNAAGAVVLATMISTHVLPSFLFILLLAVFRACFKAIMCHRHPISKPGIEFSGDLERLGQLLDIFARLNALLRRLSEVFGRYLIVEMSALFTAMLTNAFAILTGFQEGSVLWESTAVSIVTNLIWFYVLCEAGEGLQKEQKKCLKTLKGWTMDNKSPGSWMIGTLLDDEVTGVTAANYFPVCRKLATQVTGAIVMYLIVMLQFRAANRSGFYYDRLPGSK